MNDYRVCLSTTIEFGGFTVQPGMIFGYDGGNNIVVTNGKRVKNGYFIYSNRGATEDEFFKIYITAESDPKVCGKIGKALRRRERKGMDGVEYRTSDQLQCERQTRRLAEFKSEPWDNDIAAELFKEVSTPIGKTPKVYVSANPRGEAKYNAMKERSVLTQNLNICKYNKPHGEPEII